jgi:hypothetical protein
MENQKIFPLDREGQWARMEFGYFEGAINFLEDAKKLEEALSEKIEKLKVDSREYDEDSQYSYIYHNTIEDRTQLAHLCIVSMLFSCMTVEAFVNLYGVLRMGDEFYKRNIERSGISQKLEVIIAIGKQELLSKNEEIALVARRMFDKRNQLVHPKTVEVNSLDKISQLKPVPFLLDAQSMVDDMKKFFEKFLIIDPDSWMWIPGRKDFATKDS